VQLWQENGSNETEKIRKRKLRENYEINCPRREIKGGERRGSSCRDLEGEGKWRQPSWCSQRKMKEKKKKINKYKQKEKKTQNKNPPTTRPNKKKKQTLLIPWRTGADGEMVA